MSDNAEEGIARAQSQAAKTSGDHQKWLNEQQSRGGSNFADRIFAFLLTLGMLGLIVLWMTATSDLVIYGSFFSVLILIVVMGLVKIKRINQIREERHRQASEWNSKH